MCLGLDVNVCEQCGSCPRFLAFDLFLCTMRFAGWEGTAVGDDVAGFQAQSGCITGNIELDIC